MVSGGTDCGVVNCYFEELGLDVKFVMDTSCFSGISFTIAFMNSIFGISVVAQGL